jgi:hypothetical protein
VAHNEAAFRSANESLRAVFDDPSAEPQDTYPFLCECGSRECMEIVQLPLEVYQDARAHPARFVILPGHKQLDSEAVIDETDDYLVIEKSGLAGEIVRQTWAHPAPNS